MKIIKSEDNLVEFDNGLRIVGDGDVDCCAVNYIDFEQFDAGVEFPDHTVGSLIEALALKKDGFSLKDATGLPKWAQARSDQDGYYSDLIELKVIQGGKTVSLGQLSGTIEY